MMFTFFSFAKVSRTLNIASAGALNVCPYIYICVCVCVCNGIGRPPLVYNTYLATKIFLVH